jgi:hypothetical protein
LRAYRGANLETWRSVPSITGWVWGGRPGRANLRRVLRPAWLRALLRRGARVAPELSLHAGADGARRARRPRGRWRADAPALPRGARPAARAREGERPAVGVDLDSLRLFLHVLGASVWVEGQITLAALVPVLRGLGPGAAAAAARRFAAVAWPAFALLVGTGVWNLVAEHVEDRSSAYRTTLSVKLAVVVLSGLAAWLHARSTTPRARGTWGAISGLTALGALLLGVVLAR